MNEVRMYCTAFCPYCVMAERLLRQKGVVEIEKLRVDLDSSLRQEMLDKTRRRTVPQIFVGDYHVGGFDDLANLNHAGQLDRLLHPDTDTSSHIQDM
jgi:glutaredoxin 3